MKLLSCMLSSLMMMQVLPLAADEQHPFSLGVDPQNHCDISQIIGIDPHSLTPISQLPRRRTQWLMFTALWCQACQTAKKDFKPWLERSGWLVDDSLNAHVRLIDADQHAALLHQAGVQNLPTFVLMQDDRELRRHRNYPGRKILVQEFEQAVKSAPQLVAAQSGGEIPGGSLKGQREQIAQLIAIFKPLLGSDGTLTVRLDRPGTPKVVLPLGDRFSIRSENPLVMTYTLKSDVLTCRFAQPYPRGRLTFGLPVEQSISALSLSISEVILELPRAPDIRLKVEP